MGRTATGVRGIKLAENDSVVSLIIPRGEGAILTVTQNGYGKRTAAGVSDQVACHAGRYLDQSHRA
jgi:DNA gyrase/topoisomerase IV subunit A